MNVFKEKIDPRVRGFSVCTCEPDGDFYTVVINEDVGEEKQAEAYRHEMLHINRDDFHSEKSVQQIEWEVRHGS